MRPDGRRAHGPSSYSCASASCIRCSSRCKQQRPIARLHVRVYVCVCATSKRSEQSVVAAREQLRPFSLSLSGQQPRQQDIIISVYIYVYVYLYTSRLLLFHVYTYIRIVHVGGECKGVLWGQHIIIGTQMAVVNHRRFSLSVFRSLDRCCFPFLPRVWYIYRAGRPTEEDECG